MYLCKNYSNERKKSRHFAHPLHCSHDCHFCIVFIKPKKEDLNGFLYRAYMYH